jgi:addiction module HigA family antidote
LTDRTRVLEPVHPGELLQEDFLKPMGITAYRLAEDIGVRPPRIYDIVRGKRSITADTALRLSRYFGMSEGYWINAQAHYDLELEKDRTGEKIAREVKPRVNAPAVVA